MVIKKISLIGFILIISVMFFGGCSVQSGAKLTKPEYAKEVIVRKENFNDLLDNFLDQVETYNDTQASKDRLQNISNDITSFVSSIKEELGPKIPSDCKEHYNSMLAAYNLYLEGIDIYLKNLSKPLGEDRNNAIKSAEDKLHEAGNAMMNLKS